MEIMSGSESLVIRQDFLLVPVIPSATTISKWLMKQKGFCLNESSIIVSSK